MKDVLLTLWLLLLAYALPSASELMELQPGQIQYIILVSKMRPYAHSIFQELPSETQKKLDERYSGIPGSEHWSVPDYDRYIIDETFKRYPKWVKTLQIVVDQNSPLTKSQVIISLEERFNDENYSATVLYYSGPSEPVYGGWIISDDQKWKGVLSYKEVVEKWKKRQVRKQFQHLHLISDSDYSQLWAERCYNTVDFDDVSVQSSTRKNQTAFNIKYGSLYTHNLQEALLNTREPLFIRERTESQHLSGVGFEVYLQKVLGIELYHQTWDDLFRSRGIPLS